jgi:hypothetical protein
LKAQLKQELSKDLFDRIRHNVAFHYSEKLIDISRLKNALTEQDSQIKSFQLGDFNLSEKIRVAQQHYSTGMALLAGEDSVSGLIDAAFMQFYLSVEATLRSYKKDEALKQGEALFGEQFDDISRRSCPISTLRDTASLVTRSRSTYADSSIPVPRSI